MSQEHRTKAEFGTGEKCGHEILLSTNLFPWLAGGQTRKQMVSRIGQEGFNSLGRDGGGAGGLGPVDNVLSLVLQPSGSASAHLFPDPEERF